MRRCLKSTCECRDTRIGDDPTAVATPSAAVTATKTIRKKCSTQHPTLQMRAKLTCKKTCMHCCLKSTCECTETRVADDPTAVATPSAAVTAARVRGREGCHLHSLWTCGQRVESERVPPLPISNLMQTYMCTCVCLFITPRVEDYLQPHYRFRHHRQNLQFCNHRKGITSRGRGTRRSCWLAETAFVVMPARADYDMLQCPAWLPQESTYKAI